MVKLLHWHYKNVHDGVKALESIGLVGKDKTDRYVVPWDDYGLVGGVSSRRFETDWGNGPRKVLRGPEGDRRPTKKSP